MIPLRIDCWRYLVWSFYTPLSWFLSPFLLLSHFRSCMCMCRYHRLCLSFKSTITGDIIRFTSSGPIYFGASLALNVFPFWDTGCFFPHSFANFRFPWTPSHIVIFFLSLEYSCHSYTHQLMRFFQLFLQLARCVCFVSICAFLCLCSYELASVI